MVNQKSYEGPASDFLKNPNNLLFGFSLGASGIPGTQPFARASAFSLSIASKSYGVVHLRMGISPSFVLSEAKEYADGVALSNLRGTLVGPRAEPGVDGTSCCFSEG